MIHKAILQNRVPPPYTSWHQIGANTLNVRIAVVYLAEFVHKLTKLNVLKIYQLIDTVGLFFLFLILFLYLRQTNRAIYALGGLLYMAAILPLTYFHASFHPWDRVSLICWIGLIMLLRSQRLIAFTVLLAISITVKFDTIILPGLYFLANVTLGNWPRIVLRTAAMFAVAFAVFIGLCILFPGGFEARRSIVTMLLINLHDFQSMSLSYPPLLVFVVPLILAFMGLRWSDHFSRISVYFALLLFVPFVLANFIEVRAELPILVLLLPSALEGLRVLCESVENAGQGTAVPALAPGRKDQYGGPTST